MANVLTQTSVRIDNLEFDRVSLMYSFGKGEEEIVTTVGANNTRLPNRITKPETEFSKVTVGIYNRGDNQAKYRQLLSNAGNHVIELTDPDSAGIPPFTQMTLVNDPEWNVDGTETTLEFHGRKNI